MWIRIAAVALLLAPTFATSAVAADEDVVVGILENLSPERATGLRRSYGSGAAADVRVAFAKRAGRWEAFKSDVGDLDQLETASQDFPRKVAWTITFDGKPRGQLESASPNRWLAYRDIGIQVITSAGKVPRLGNRPLVLASQGDVRDPEQWRRAKLDDPDLRRGRAHFRTQVKTEDASLGFEDRDVQPVKAYRSKAGKVLFALAIRGRKSPADEVPSAAWSLHWFVADNADSIRFLGSELDLIDAGDYDRDGRSEVIFVKASYNANGYILFFDNFRQSAQFVGSDH